MIYKTAFAAVAAAFMMANPAMAETKSNKDQTALHQSGTAAITFYNAQASNQHLASAVIGAPVKNNSDEQIGDVNDAVIDPSGKVAALVIGVGGFLEVGEKNVAVSIESIDVKEENKAIVVYVNASKAQLEKAEPFKANETGATLSERWDRLQKSMQETAETVQKKMNESTSSQPKAQ